MHYCYLMYLRTLRNTGNLLIVEKDIRSGKSHTIHRYAKANNIRIKYFDENKESSSLKYWEGNNLF